jgi:4-hydroxy-3-polyprenylbenzoate decarboxylase
VDLTALPVLHCWPQDAGPFVTLPLVFTRSLETGRRNVGMYRLQIFDRCTTGMHWHIHKDGSHYYTEYCRAGQRMPVAVAIGADPATTYAATAPMPRGVDEMLLAGFIRNKPVRMTRCVTVDLEVPAEAEFVLEGYVDPGELRREGPFGDHTGYYSLADDYPVFHVTAVTHRRRPIYNATLVGRPPMEDCYLAKATERLFLPMLQTVIPEIRDYWFPLGGRFSQYRGGGHRQGVPGACPQAGLGLVGAGADEFLQGHCSGGRRYQSPGSGRGDDGPAAAPGSGQRSDSDPGGAGRAGSFLPHATFGSKLGIDLTRRVPGGRAAAGKRAERPATAP